MIIFEAANVEVGKLVPTCYVVLQDGKFSTPPEESPTTGTYNLQILAIDTSRLPAPRVEGIARDRDDSGPPALFPQYVLTVEIPPPNNHLDIVVPEAAQRRRVPAAAGRDP
jgi:hypothetical protein